MERAFCFSAPFRTCARMSWAMPISCTKRNDKILCSNRGFFCAPTRILECKNLRFHICAKFLQIGFKCWASCRYVHNISHVDLLGQEHLRRHCSGPLACRPQGQVNADGPQAMSQYQRRAYGIQHEVLNAVSIECCLNMRSAMPAKNSLVIIRFMTGKASFPERNHRQ